MTTASFHPLKPEAWESFLQFLLPHSPNNPTESISKFTLDAVLCRPLLPQVHPPLALCKHHTDFLGARELSHAVSILPIPTCLLLWLFPQFLPGQKPRRAKLQTNNNTENKNWYQAPFHTDSLSLSFWDSASVAQSGLELGVYPRVILNSWSSCLHLLSARITGVHHHAGLLNHLTSSSKSLRNEFPITLNLNVL